MWGDLVEVTERGVEIRKTLVHDGTEYRWARKLGTRRAVPEEAPQRDQTERDVSNLSLEELANELRGVALYEGHEFVEARLPLALAARVKEEQALGEEATNPKGIPSTGEAESIDFRLVVGTDNRLVRNNKLYPYRTNIVLDNVGGTAIGNPQGTATLIGRSTAMSVAHVFWDEGANDWEADMSWAPGFDSGDIDSSPWGDWFRCYFVTIPNGYINNESFTYDYAVIDFDVGCNSVDNGVNSDEPGSTVGWLGYWVAPVTTIAGILYVDGYPGDDCPGEPCATRLWGHSNSGTSAAGNDIDHYVDTGEGQSGSAAWLVDGGLQYLVGMHQGFIVATNRARRYTNGVHDFMTAHSSEY